MVSQGTLLRTVQYRAQRKLDDTYRQLANAVHALILRHAAPDQHGILRLALPSRAAILAGLSGLLNAALPALFRDIGEAMSAARDAAQADVAPLPPDLTHELNRASVIYRSLSVAQMGVISQTGALLSRGIALGHTARRIADSVRQYFSPFYSTYRSETGKLLHTARKGAIEHWPGRAGMASQHARMKMLTETTDAHARTMVQLAQRDGMGLRWRLSGNHPKTDVCDGHARRDSGYGRGIYLPGDLPPLPTHNRCRCSVEAVPLVPR